MLYLAQTPPDEVDMEYAAAHWLYLYQQCLADNAWRNPDEQCQMEGDDFEQACLSYSYDRERCRQDADYLRLNCDSQTADMCATERNTYEQCTDIQQAVGDSRPIDCSLEFSNLLNCTESYTLSQLSIQE